MLVSTPHSVSGEAVVQSVSGGETVAQSVSGEAVMQPLKEDYITHPPNEEPPHPSKEPTPSLTKEEPPLVSSLRRVLLAISVIRDDIQYCQGMNLRRVAADRDDGRGESLLDAGSAAAVLLP